jgi:hypothetical protein
VLATSVPKITLSFIYGITRHFPPGLIQGDDEGGWHYLILIIPSSLTTRSFLDETAPLRGIFESLSTQGDSDHLRAR